MKRECVEHISIYLRWQYARIVEHRILHFMGAVPWYRTSDMFEIGKETPTKGQHCQPINSLRKIGGG